MCSMLIKHFINLQKVELGPLNLEQIFKIKWVSNTVDY